MIRTGLIWSCILILVMSAMSAYGYATIPADAQIAVHWNITGDPDRYADKTFALWIIPAIALGISLLLAMVPVIEPRRKNLLESSGLYVRTWIGSMMVLTLANGVVMLSGLGMDLPVARLVIAAVGLLLVLIGNILGKSQSNFFIGIRTPWTLSSDVAWDKTHRLAGRLWVLGGLSIAVLAFMVETSDVVGMIIGVVVFITAVPLVASYFYWRKDKPGRSGKA